ncbi:FliG C-terminal domain-containing protein [Vibrio sp. D431a]|uniref:FliG C-terminal domain-containing protein n=1 Tax=Vibrio sp. D431a TaxID=2837388 RepID=UPI0025549688|nr:FliG C-terminal domain-containing protein [Vibrio sp. D431a]MDK9793917.1 hypothetical protein [Vibrio sp. D431a]
MSKINPEGVRKVAMLVKMLTPQMMTPITKHLPREVIEAIDKIVEEDKTVIKTEGLEVLREFNAIGSLIVAPAHEMTLLDEYDEAKMAESPNAINKKVHVGFYKLAEQKPDVIYRIIKDEQPISQVVVLRQLPQKVSQDVFTNMSTDEQVAITLAGKTSGDISEEILESISRTFEAKIEEMLSEKKTNFDIILNLASTLDDIGLETLLAKLPDDLAEEIRSATLTFKDILAQTDSVLQQVFGNFGGAVIAAAIVPFDEELRERVFANVTDSKRENIEYSLGEIDPSKKKQINDAQREIVLEAKALQQKGTIEIVK